MTTQIFSQIPLCLLVISLALTSTLSKQPSDPRNSRCHFLRKIADKEDIKFCWNDLRLPKDLIPQSYEVLILPDLQKSTFSGWSNVEVTVKKSTGSIVLHSKNLTISSVNIRYKDLNDAVTVKKWRLDESLEQMQVELSTPLVAGSSILLNISFTGVIKTDSLGFYLTSYKTKENVVRLLAATQFQPTEARSAFPCFDEPHMKATFQFNIIRPNDYISLFNTEKISEKAVSMNETMDTFNITVKMSTYLVAFVVCDFLSKSQMSKSGVNVVYSKPDTIDNVDFALDSTTRLLDYFEEFFAIRYPFTILDSVAVPGMFSNGMENWGLILYSANYITYNESASTQHDKTYLVVLVAHEVSHQWFGNLVTMEWWDDLWLNEGFATYIMYIGAKHILPESPLMEIFAFNVIEPAMADDSLDSSHPVISPVNNPKYISEIFDLITYYKGASLIRMLENVAGSDVFNEALRSYLHKHQYATATHDDLWAAFPRQLSKVADLNVKEMMETWTLQMGLPLVTINRDGRHVTCSQKRFVIIDHSEIRDFQPESSPFKLIRNELLPLAFDLGFPEYVKWARDSFQKVKNGSLVLTPNQEPIVLKYAVRYGGEEEWNHVMNLLKTSQSRRTVILEALTFTNESSKFNGLLETALSKPSPGDLHLILRSLKNSPNMAQLQWSFIKNNWSRMRCAFHNIPRRLRPIFKPLASLFRTEDQYDDLKTFLGTHMKDSDRLNIYILDAVQMNINWLSKSQKQLVQWLNAQSLR
ncbi:hypothetical protein HELRODRAFT_193509 [Helobdella robusta]|uniref:Aminopeptidase n=1 Tax=Helobdella robusta TaxID=6412 RepID=T1FV25_HELRO|nr:hypothetical protein HELRODRAFT_193509 [Helobdella robusta]ESN95738.1 hypothetical protein HELRODRAFT_193509 [Helobdella robusta]